MVIHIFPRSKFLEPFVDFLYQNFDVSEHKIFCFDECGFQLCLLVKKLIKAPCEGTGPFTDE